MAPTTEIANMIFKRVEGKELSVFNNDIQMFNIIMAMDGRRSVGTIARENYYEVEFLSEKVKQLVQMEVLELVEEVGGQAAMNLEVIKYLQAKLTKLIGPIAGKLIKEAAAKMGHDITSFPSGKFNELLDRVSLFIQNRGEAIDFKRSMKLWLTRQNLD